MDFLYLHDISTLNLGLMLLGAALCLAAYTFRVVYHALRYTRKKEIIAFRASVVLITLGYLGWGYWSAADPVKMALPTAVGLGVGVPLTAAGVVLFVLSESKHRGRGDQGELITTGIYARIRHPMYLGLILLHLGYPLIYRSFVALLSTALWGGCIAVWKYFEEKRLEEIHGQRYRDYKESTWF